MVDRILFGNLILKVDEIMNFQNVFISEIEKCILMKTVVLLPSETSETKHLPGTMAQCLHVARELNACRLITEKTPPLELPTSETSLEL